MSKEDEVASICARLAQLEAEPGELNQQLERLRSQQAQERVLGRGSSSITADSSAAEKIYYKVREEGVSFL